MRPLLLLVASLLLLSVVPAAEAHQCSGTGCGPCVKGEEHQHADNAGKACNSGPGYIQDAGYNGASNDVPAWGLLGTLGTLAGLALARRAA